MLHLIVFHNYIQPSAEILGIRIDEPVTTATDLILAAICFYAFFRIMKHKYSGRMKWYFDCYFLTLGLGSVFGALLGHAFQYGLAEQWKLVSWILTLASVALMIQALLELARPLLKPGYPVLISGFNILGFAIALFYTIWTISFSPVVYYSLYGLLVMAGSLGYYIYRRTGSRGMLILLGALGIGFISAIVFSFEWGLGPWFNHRDMSHVILSFSAFCLYRGVATILDGLVLVPRQ